MSLVVKYIIAFFIGMLLGNFFISIFISRFFHGKDIRESGSGNPGATNMARQHGLASGIATLAFDVLKAVVAVYFGRKLCGDWGVMFAGIGVIVGHCFPVIHHFAGGKGIAVGVVLCFAVHWLVGTLVIILFIIGAVISKKVSIGSICGALTLIIMSIFMPVALPLKIMGIFSGVLAIYRHKENIKRIIAGTEPDFKLKH